MSMSKSLKINEKEVKVLHEWILALCDPERSLCATMARQFKKIANETRDDKTGLEKEEISLANLLSILTEDNMKQEMNKTTAPEDGAVRLACPDQSLFEGFFWKGKPHGFFRIINSFGDVEFFGCLVQGVLQGVAWRSLPGGGFIIGSSYQFNGDDVTYLYPDCRLGFVGRFDQSLLHSGYLVEVSGYISLLQGCVLKPVTVGICDEEYTSDISGPVKLCQYPHLQDPYEQIFVEVGPSKFNSAGEGLFAKVDIEVGTIISFYNGIKVPAGNDTDQPSPYKISLDENFDIDLPEEFTCLTAYSATLGHKVCHSFEPNCDVDVFFHPRFGNIRCVATMEDIEKGEEITINYRYNLARAPTWYKVAWAKHQKMVRGLPNWKSAMNSSRRSSSDDSHKSEAVNPVTAAADTTAANHPESRTADSTISTAGGVELIKQEKTDKCDPHLKQ